MAKKPKPPVRRSPNSSVWLQIAIVGLWTALAQWFLWDKLYFTGDEPHYMMSVVSFVLDGDFNNYNNYQRGHSALFGVSDLQPQWAAYGFPRPGLIPAEHGTAFPLLISPIFRLWGIDGLRVAFIVCSAVACLLSGWTAKTLSGSVAVGWGALGLLLIAPVWQMQASRIYPETLAALLVALITAILTLHVKDLKRRRRGWLLFTCGFCIILLPILYAKYVVIGAGFGIACLLLPSIRSRPAFWAGLGLALLLGLFNA
ncbi:MAG TPA: hypothetical protein VEQ63_07320, partial [Bryobacteraceae bacterium]|nr:hypothetical protein [Bryobacteraceae bacterium]